MKIQLTNLPIIGSLINFLDENIQKYGLQKGMLNLATHSGTKLKVSGLTSEVEKILKTGRVVVVANHPHESDEIALIAVMPERKDFYLIGNYLATKFSESLTKYIIPIYINHHRETRKLIPYEFLIKRFYSFPIFSEEEEHRKNIQSISQASLKVKNGGLVIIFPGRRSINGKWYTGIGHLLKGAECNKRIYLIMAYIEGTRDSDYLRIIPKIGKFLPEIKVAFAAPRVVNNILGKPPKEITSILEEEYNNWVKTATTNGYNQPLTIYRTYGKLSDH